MTCTFESLNAMNIINNIELIIIYALTVVTLISDLISNYQMILKCRVIQYLFYRDPYWFRPQILLFMPFMVFSFVVGAISLSNTNYGDIVNSFVATVILNTIQAGILFSIDVLFPLSITIVTAARSLICYKRKGYDQNTLVKDMKNEVLEKAFVDFCRKEFSIENYSCWRGIQEWKETARKLNASSDEHKELLREGANNLVRLYFNGVHSEFEVNIPNTSNKAIHASLLKDVISGDIFDAVEVQILSNMGDTYARFSMTRLYETVKADQRTQMELLEAK
jgi:hypothetical protein